MAYVPKPKGERANFDTECVKCRGVLTISNGRVDYHECRPVTLEQIRAALGK